MNDREKFEAWCATKLFPTSWREDTGANVSWLACAEQKDKEIAELKDTIHSYEVALANATAYLGSAKHDIAALKAEIEKLKEPKIYVRVTYDDL